MARHNLLFLPLVMATMLTVSNSQRDCKTVSTPGGSRRAERCIFPFRFGGKSGFGFSSDMKYSQYRLQCPRWDHHKIGTIADLALIPILLLDEAVEVDGGRLEDPHGLRDGRRVLEGPQGGRRVLVATAGAFPGAEYCGACE